jgi:predicted signal transduction protein with EAL and GGDEF domain
MKDVPGEAKVFINLHPHDLVDEELCSKEGALTPHASRIVLEVTERAALDGVHGLAAGVARLRELGYRLALDDLGAGYAGLSSFALLEPEIVKVDMHWCAASTPRPQAEAFRSFATLCRELDVEIIAEGVRVAEERDCPTTGRRPLPATCSPSRAVASRPDIARSLSTSLFGVAVVEPKPFVVCGDHSGQPSGRHRRPGDRAHELHGLAASSEAP